MKSKCVTTTHNFIQLDAPIIQIKLDWQNTTFKSSLVFNYLTWFFDCCEKPINLFLHAPIHPSIHVAA